jgi:hypothetical protein
VKLRPGRPTFSREIEAELDALAQISEDDKLRVAEAWRRDASPRFKNLLDAKPGPGKKPRKR